MLCVHRTSGPCQRLHHHVLPFSTTGGSPPRREGWAALVKSRPFKEQLGKHLTFKCCDPCLTAQLQALSLWLQLLSRSCFLAHAGRLLCPSLRPVEAAAWSHGCSPTWACILKALAIGALLFCCLWLIGSLRPDILQDSSHRQPGKLRGTERAWG